jgi:hypothetical protein
MSEIYKLGTNKKYFSNIDSGKNINNINSGKIKVNYSTDKDKVLV